MKDIDIELVDSAITPAESTVELVEESSELAGWSHIRLIHSPADS